MVLVCNKHPFIFLKTRKTAGTSIEMVLEPLCVPPGTEIVEFCPQQVSDYGIVGRRGHAHRPTGWRKPMRLVEWWDHQPAASVRRRLGRREWDRRVKITTVRNPFDRMVSYFRFRHRRVSLPDEIIPLREKFREYVRHANWSDDRRVVFVDGKFIIDHAVRFEHMARDLRDIAARLNLPLESELPVTKSMANARKSHDVPDYYDRDLIETVKTRMSWVFDHYDYPLEPQPKYAVSETT